MTYFLLCSLMPLLMVGTLAYILGRDSLKKTTLKRLDTAVTLKEAEINSWVQEKERLMALLVRTPTVKEWAPVLIESPAGSSKFNQAYEILLSLFNMVRQEVPDIFEISILRKDGGKVILSTTKEVEGNFHLSDTFYKRGIEGPFTQNVYFSSALKRTTISIANPIKDKKGQVIGLLVGHLDLNRLDQIVLERTGLGETGETYLIDSTNSFISEARGGKEQYFRGVHTEGIDNAVQKKSDGSGLYKNYEGIEIVGVYRWLDEREMALLAEMHQSEAFSLLRNLAWAFLGIGLVSFGLISFGMYLVSKQITGPILALTEAAQKVSAGELDCTAPIITSDEVGLLAHTFNKMTRQLRMLYSSLEARLKTVVANAPVILFSIDKKGVYTLMEGKGLELLSLRPRELVGCSIFDVYKDVPQMVASTQKALEGKSISKTVEINHLIFESWFSPIYDQNQELAEVIGVLIDITELKRTEERLIAAKEEAEAASRVKSMFLANTSHELRTPLNAIIGYSEILEEDLADLGQDHLLPDLQKIKSSAQHLLSLISDILDITKIEAGKMEFFLEDVKVDELVNDVVNTATPLVHKNKSQLHVETADELGLIHVDKLKVRQSLLNLLSNAAKFTQEGQVSLIVRREKIDLKKIMDKANQGDETEQEQIDPEEGEFIIFKVRDTGIGIDPTKIEKLFDAFSQEDASTTRRFGGTGLGLAISRRLCRMMGGEIYVESVQGEGSTFTMFIPVVMKDELLENG